MPGWGGFQRAAANGWSRGYERTTRYEAASREYVGLEMVSGVAVYTLS